MSRIVKIVIAVVVTLLCVASMGVLAMRDASRRPEYCNTCHVVQPYYETWAEGDLLAHQHAVAGVPCQRCHPQDMQDTLQENVANLQGGDSVVITDSEWSDRECLACHGDEATLAERTQSLDPNPHASPHVGEELRCTQCHKMHELSQDPCIECHTDVDTGPGWTTEVTQALDIQVWSPDMDCAACHSMEPYAESLQDSGLLAYAHAQEGLSCPDCHELGALREVHEAAVPGARVRRLTVKMQVCFDCHVANEHTSYDQIIQRTKDYVIDGQNINPHDPHANAVQPQAQLECNVCHSMHQQSRLINGCYGCHHEENFEPCSACHSEYS